MMLERYIAGLVEGEDLSEQEAHDALSAIMSGEATDAQIAGFLVALRVKGETVAEITGCARAMREAATHIEAGDADVVDTCGTGGTGKGTFNISTTAALVAAGAGVPIAKHGNRAASGHWGSADVLEALGVNLAAEPAVVQRCIREAGIGFLFAPALHKAMKYAIGPRRELGLRTVFNILGPLTNPAGARRQVLGVFHQDLVETMARVLGNLGAVRAMVVHSVDGMDEISVCDRTFVAELNGGRVETRYIAPEDVGLPRSSPDQLTVEGLQQSAAAVRSVLAGEPGPRRDIVLFNAAAAIYVGEKAESLAGALEAAAESIDSGRAKETLDRLASVSQSAA
ncbi:MAG: anthranilate phosphoribosyltransferase [Candidatus Brocadiae bacterium]|nr:anthranilate phosphoribosyltransferase [Candidatus Brocadiia bacterium]